MLIKAQSADEKRAEANKTGSGEAQCLSFRI